MKKSGKSYQFLAYRWHKGTHRFTHIGLIIAVAVSPFNTCEEKKIFFEGQLNSMFAIGYSANKHYNFSLNCKIASK